jgi:alkylation response protein AidB-like acyl-CoA dehydrogenase
VIPNSAARIKMTTTRKGGDWLLEETSADAVFTPEKLSDEHRMIRQTAEEFAAKEVVPALADLEKKDWALARKLLQRGGELGLIGVDTPEEYGGVGLDKAASVVVGGALGGCASFSATFGAQTGLTIIPILCFGTEAQKQKYLTKIVSGEMIGAYCLSESGSGSDALAARTKAVKAADGSWILNGEKMWITNGGFADVFIVFAKVFEEESSLPAGALAQAGASPREAFSAFIVERSFPGVSSGKEEHKMGLHGSSTTPVILQDAKVPAENLLGEVGKGHKIAFNVLNYGRFKLAAMVAGGSKMIIGEAARYASTRKQFGVSINTFGAIKHKLGEMVAREYAVESMLYRTTGLIDAAIEAGSGEYAAKALASLEEFAIEASILKVAASELTDFVVDENVQIHGGNGFVKDYPAEGHYRDARVNRIFEGTNEINRLLIPGMLVKRALKGGLPLIDAAKKLQDSLLTVSAPAASVGRADLEARRTIQGMKDVSVALLGLALQTFGAKLEEEQEVMMLIADCVIDTFAAESAVLRAESNAGNSLHQTAAELVVSSAANRVDLNARAALPAIVSGDTLKVMQSALKRLLKVPSVNAVALRRSLSDAATERKAYPF